MSTPLSLLQRSVAILERLPREPATISTPALHNKLLRSGFAMSRRVLHKDLARISHELPVICFPGKPSRWAWGEHAAPFEAAANEPAGVLLMALVQPTLQAVLPPSLTAHFEAAFARALDLGGNETYRELTRRVRALPEALPRSRPHAKPQHVEALLEALIDQQRVHARYKRRNAPRPLDYHLGPLALVSVGPRLILIARKVGEPKVRHYEVQRFHSIKPTAEPTEAFDDFDLDAHIAAGELAFPKSSDWLDLDLEFGPEHADELQDAPLSPDQTVSGAGDARRLRAQVADTWALQRFLLGLGSQATVRGPVGYATRLAAEVQQMAENYAVHGSAPLDPDDRLDVQLGLLVPAQVRKPEVLRLLADLTWQLMNWAKPRGAVVLGPGHVLSDGVGADLSVYASGKMVGPPDLVVDVLDGSTDGRARVRKAEWYRQEGVPERWVVDPGERVALRYVAEGARWVEVAGVTGKGELASQELGVEVTFEL